MKLEQPYQALQEIVDEYDIDKLDDKHKKLVPFFVILMKEIQKWKDEVTLFFIQHEGSIPKGSQEQSAFRKQIQALGGKLEDEENYTEASNNLSSIFKPSGYIPDEVQALLDSVQAASPQDANSFDTYVLALKKFIEKNKRTPVSQSNT